MRMRVNPVIIRSSVGSSVSSPIITTTPTVPLRCRPSPLPMPHAIFVEGPPRRPCPPRRPRGSTHRTIFETIFGRRRAILRAGDRDAATFARCDGRLRARPRPAVAIAKTTTRPSRAQRTLERRLEIERRRRTLVAATPTASTLIAFEQFSRVHLEQPIHTTVADRHRDDPLAHANHRDPLLRSEREPLHDFHTKRGTGRRRRREAAKQLEGDTEQREHEAERAAASPITEPKVTRRPQAPRCSTMMRVMRTPKCSPSTTTSPSANRRSAT